MERPRKIKVCIVAASTDIIGGQAIQARRLLEDLRREPGIEASLLPINPRLPWVFRKLQRIKYVRTLITSILYNFMLVMRLPRFDVVHVFSASYLSFLLAPAPAIIIAKLYGKPVLLNYHSGEAEDHLTRWRRTALPIIKLADRIIVPSDYLVNIFGRFGLQAKAIFNTVDLATFKFRRRRPLQPVLLSNRNLESHYNVSGTLRAFALIEKRLRTARLVIAGSGSELGKLQNLAAELDIKNVEFIGAVPPEQMPALYDRADIFINSSNVDNMPLSIIEAFACGLPVVTTNAGGIKHMIAHGCNGLMVARGDHNALADSVLALLKDSECAERMIDVARNECLRYTWPEVRSKWLSVYAELAGHARSEADGSLRTVIEVRAGHDTKS